MPRPHVSVPFSFENATLFLRFKKKIASTRSVFRPFSPVHTKTAKNANTAERACAFSMPFYLFHLRALFEYVAVGKTG